MLRNLKEVHRGARDLPQSLKVLQRLVVLLPGDWSERRDRGLVCAELGLDQTAAADLRAYLEHSPEAVDRTAIEAQLADILRRRPSRRH